MAKVSAPAQPKTGGTTGATLLQQYESAISRAGQGTGGNPLGDFQQGAQAFWDQSANLRGYADQLRGQARGHEKDLAGIQAGAKRGVAAAQAGAQKAAARMQADASKFSSRVGADTEKYLGRLGLKGTKYQTDGRVQEAQIGAGAQRAVASMQAGAQRYVADVGLESDLAGFASSERIAGGVQAGENFRTGLNVAGSLLMNQNDNFTERQGQLYDYSARIAQSQWKAPDVNNIRYWG